MMGIATGGSEVADAESLLPFHFSLAAWRRPPARVHGWAVATRVVCSPAGRLATHLGQHASSTFGCVIARIVLDRFALF